MTASNKPRHGDGIIEVKKDALGGKKFVASWQFQRFLDSLGSEQDAATIIETIIEGDSIAIGKVRASLGALSKKQDEMFELAAQALLVASKRTAGLTKAQVSAAVSLGL